MTTTTNKGRVTSDRSKEWRETLWELIDNPDVDCDIVESFIQSLLDSQRQELAEKVEKLDTIHHPDYYDRFIAFDDVIKLLKEES